MPPPKKQLQNMGSDAAPEAPTVDIGEAEISGFTVQGPDGRTYRVEMGEAGPVIAEENDGTPMEAEYAGAMPPERPTPRPGNDENMVGYVRGRSEYYHPGNGVQLPRGRGTEIGERRRFQEEFNP